MRKPRRHVGCIGAPRACAPAAAQDAPKRVKLAKKSGKRSDQTRQIAPQVSIRAHLARGPARKRGDRQRGGWAKDLWQAKKSGKSAQFAPQVHSQQSGFTLLEILIAFTIAAVSVTLLARIFSTALEVTARAGDVTQATLIAQSKLAQAGSAFALEDGGQSGEEMAGAYKWQLTIAPYEIIRVEPPDAPVTITPLGQPLEMKQITAVVRYGEPSRNVTLVTYKTIGKRQ